MGKGEWRLGGHRWAVGRQGLMDWGITGFDVVVGMGVGTGGGEQ